jgi:hypothetical protein
VAPVEPRGVGLIALALVGLAMCPALAQDAQRADCRAFIS